MGWREDYEFEGSMNHGGRINREIWMAIKLDNYEKRIKELTNKVEKNKNCLNCENSVKDWIDSVGVFGYWCGKKYAEDYLCDNCKHWKQQKE